MGNKNYVNGASRERRIKRRLEEQGWLVTRASGSKGYVDLIGISKEKKEIKFLQVKPKNFNKKEIARLCEKYSWINDEFVASFGVIDSIKIEKEQTQ